MLVIAEVRGIVGRVSWKDKVTDEEVRTTRRREHFQWSKNALVRSSATVKVIRRSVTSTDSFDFRCKSQLEKRWNFSLLRGAQEWVSLWF